MIIFLTSRLRCAFLLVTCAMKPDAGLARIFEGVKGFAECPGRVVSGVVAEYAQAVEEIGDLWRQDSLEPQAAKQIGLGFIARLIRTRLRGNELGQQLPRGDRRRMRSVVARSTGSCVARDARPLFRLSEGLRCGSSR